MVKTIKLLNMKTSRLALLSAILIISMISDAVSQITVSLGTQTGAGSTNVLLSTSTTTNRYSRTISLYSASEIINAGGQAGSISSLAWLKGGTGEYTSANAYIKVYLKNHVDTAWGSVPSWDTQVVGATEVFTSSTYSIPTGTGWKTVSFTTPFVWNGTSNIAVFVEWDRASAPTGDITWARSTTTNANSSRVGSTSLAALVMLINSNRPLLQLTINTAPPVPVSSIAVSTQGSVPATISTIAGTIQMQSTILPANANQAVNWSIVNGTGMASISPTGLVTAQSNGTVWAKAVSVQDTTKKDSLQITITNQPVQITSVAVATQGSVPAVITTNGGTLQMQSTILPANANQAVNWSIVNGTGLAGISATGLVTAQSNGTVWAKAVSVQDAGKKDSLLITISNQIVPITSIAVATQGSVPAVITTNGGTLQMQSTILPANANQAVNWSIVNGTGLAGISATGLVTAQSNGTVWAKAVSVQDASKKDSLLITISNQTIPVTSVTVSTQGGVPAVISIKGGSLQLVADVLPSSANQNVIWAINNVSGSAVISSAGLVAGFVNGTVYASAQSVQDPTKKDSILISISGQDAGMNDINNSESFTIYPNPVSGRLNVKISEALFQSNAIIMVLDATGRVVIKEKVNSTSFSLQLENFTPGIYLLRYEDENKQLSKTFIAE